MKLENSSKEEWFTIKNDELVRLSEETMPEAFNYYKLGYWTSYGFILEGEANEVGKIYSRNDVLKTVELVDSSNNVIQSFVGANTNWYDASTYSGYQATLTKSKLSTMNSGSYKVQVRVKTAGMEFVLPVSQKQNNSRLYVGDYQEQIDQIPSDTTNNFSVSFETVSGQMQLTITKDKNQLNRLS
ncbi:hypothetical protein [Enterococcus thailandicus]|uniref:hypothetical protein n=1 Tax=Enterococcus thailandicus TaxID=417368 RepID=UPI0035D73660